MADLSIAIEILGKDSFSAAAGSVQKGVGGLLGGFKELGLGIFGITQTFDLAKGAIEGLIGPAIDAEQVATQTAAVLKSTGEAAGLTADDISGLAGSLSKLTPFEDEAIQSAENLLLTFTNIGGDIFPQATETILDMSQALGQDLKSSSVQLGKALNDPVKGITALSRVGVSFTEDQKQMIGAMVEAGDVAGAQQVILAELGKEFGGAAKAAGQTFGGQMVILQTAVGNVAEAIGGPLVKGLSSLATSALPAVQAFADDLPGAIEAFTEQLSGLGEQFAPTIQFLTDAWATLVQVFQGDWEASDSIDPVVNVIGQLAAIVRDDVLPALTLLGGVVTDVFAGDFASAFDGMQQILNEALPFLVEDLATMGQAFLSWVGPMIPPLLAQLVSLGLQIGTWINTVAFPLLVENLATWAGAFIDWVAPLIPPLLVELGQLLLQLGTWLVNVALPSLATNLLKWGLAFTEWIAPRIPLLIGELVKLNFEMLGWIATVALPAIIEKVGEWGAAFVNWVATDVLPSLPGELAKIGQGIISWVDGALPEVEHTMEDIGAAIILGIEDGITAAWTHLTDFFGSKLRDLFPFAQKAIQADSPSRLAARLIGQPIAQGIAVGIHEGGGAINDVMRIIVNEAIKNGIDPLIALALAKAESDLNPNAIGDSGASVGLFQLHERGQGAGQSVAQRQDPQHNAGQFLAAHAALYKQLVAEGLAGEQLAATFGRLAEVSDPRFAYRYAEAYRALAAQFGSTSLAAAAAGQGQAMLASTQQQGVTWAEQMAQQQAALTQVLEGQAPPLRNTKEAMTAFGAVLGPIERQVAGGRIGLETLEFKLIDLARATGLATEPWDRFAAGTIDADRAMEQVINSAADAGPEFDALRKYFDSAGASTREAALQFLQLALNYKQATPAIEAVATSTGKTADQTGEATDAVGSLTQKYDALGPKIGDATKLVQGFQGALDELKSDRVDDIASSFGRAGERIDDATGRLREFIDKLNEAQSAGDGLPGFATGGIVGGGPRGSAQHIIAHSGEMILNDVQQRMVFGGGAASAGGGSGDVIFNFPHYVGSRSELISAVKSGLIDYKRSNGKMPWE